MARRKTLKIFVPNTSKNSASGEENGAFAPLLQPTYTVRILTATGREERLREGTCIASDN
jgi:hypothetical protein